MLRIVFFSNIFKIVFLIGVKNMVLIGVVVDELYAIMSNVPIWGLWTRPGKGEGTCRGEVHR